MTMPKKRTATELHDAVLEIADREIQALQDLKTGLDDDDVDRLTKLEKFVCNRLSDERTVQALELKQKPGDLSRAEALKEIRSLLELDPEMRAIAAEVLKQHRAQ